MYYVNMKNDFSGELICTRDKSSAYPFVATSEDAEGAMHFGITADKRIALTTEGDNIFAAGLKPADASLTMSDLFSDPKDRAKLTYSDVQDTEDNPIIVVLCDEIGLFKNVEAELKVLYLGSFGILAALIRGACTFNGVALQRCNSTDLESRDISKVLHGVDFKEYIVATNRELEYNALWDSVHHVVMKCTENKDGVSFSIHQRTEMKYTFDTKGMEEAQARFEARKKREAEIAEQKRLKRLEYEKAEAERRQREAERIAAEEAEKAEKALKKAQEKAAKAETKTLTASAGAQAFLAVVRGLS